MATSTKPRRSPLMERLESFVDKNIDKMSTSELRRFERRSSKIMKKRQSRGTA